MKVNYYPETDSLYVDLSSKPSVDSSEVDGVVLDYDSDGNLTALISTTPARRSRRRVDELDSGDYF